MTNYDYTAQFIVTIAQNDSTGVYTAFVYKGEKAKHAEFEACDEDPYRALAEAMDWIDEEADRLELDEEEDSKTRDY